MSKFAMSEWANSQLWCTVKRPTVFMLLYLFTDLCSMIYLIHDPTPKKRKQPILSHIVGVSFSTVYQRFTDFCMVDFFWRMGFVNRHLVYRSVFYRDNFSFLTYCKTFFCKFRFLSRPFFDNFSYKQIHKKRGWENCVKLRNSWCYMSKN